MNDLDLQNQFVGIFTGKIPNRLSQSKILEGAKIVDVTVTVKQMVSWTTAITPSSLKEIGGGHYWLKVLLLTPIEEIPLLINHHSKHIRDTARYRLKLGK